jgi:predicted RNase H-like nuclease (RuvC/YqgF family)
MKIPESDYRKLAGILARLASDHEGERAAAALLVTKIMAKHGGRPEQLLRDAPRPTPEEASSLRASAEVMTLRAKLRSCAEEMENLRALNSRLHKSNESLREEVASLRGNGEEDAQV